MILVNFLLVIIAFVLKIILEVVSFFYVVLFKKRWEWGKIIDRANGYFRNSALAEDRSGNEKYRSFFNYVLIKEDGYQFGNIQETISSVLGKNQRDGTLARAGKILCWILDKIDKNHCQNAIKEL